MNLKLAEIVNTMISAEDSALGPLRKEFWKHNFSSQFQIEWVETDGSNFSAWLKAHQDLNAVLFSESFSKEAIKASREIPTEVKNTGVADCIIREHGHFIPRILLKETLRLLMTENKSHLDSRAIAYIVGAGEMIKPAVAVAVQLGFSKIHLVDADIDLLMKHAEDLTKRYFGLSFILIKDSELTLQPSNGSLLINTVSKDQNPGLIEDISYMNFLKADGLIVDVPFSKDPGQIVEEAKIVGISVVPSQAVQAYRDYELLQKLSVPSLCSRAEYLNLWSQFLKRDKGPVT